MRKRAQNSQRQIKVNTKATEPKRWRTFLMTTVCGLLLMSGFFFAGRQHFSSIDYGMKNSKLRRQVDELEAEKRRLMLAREVSLTPGEIKRSAKKSGILDAPAEGMVAQVTSATKEKAVPQASAPAAASTAATTNVKPLIIKTAAVTAAPSRPVEANIDMRPARIVKPLKKSTTTAE